MPTCTSTYTLHTNEFLRLNEMPKLIIIIDLYLAGHIHIRTQQCADKATLSLSLYLSICLSWRRHFAISHSNSAHIPLLFLHGLLLLLLLESFNTLLPLSYRSVSANVSASRTFFSTESSLEGTISCTDPEPNTTTTMTTRATKTLNVRLR